MYIYVYICMYKQEVDRVSEHLEEEAKCLISKTQNLHTMLEDQQAAGRDLDALTYELQHTREVLGGAELQLGDTRETLRNSVELLGV